MPIEFRCSECQQLLRVPDDSAGKSARCPKCQALMVVPAPAPRADQPAADLSPFAALPASPPAKPPPGNPFGEVGGFAPPPGSPFASAPTAPSLNPYATPAAFGYTQPFPTGPRPGLPWENSRSVGSWFGTMSLVIGSPSQAFSQMRQTGGMGGPILFSFYSLAVPGFLIGILMIPLFLFLSFGAAGDDNPPAQIGMALGMAVGLIVAIAIYILLLVTVGALIYAAIIHVCLLLVGGAKQGFETTFRVVSFTQGAITPVAIVLGCLPYVGGLIHIVWLTTVTIIGISKAHEIPGGRAAAAVLLPLGICFGVVVAFVAVAVVMDAN
jgi:DNA-directed RNA polymerase subunit RPC12/RpoP